MFGFLIYAIIMTVAFSFCYIFHKRIRQNKRSYDDGDSVFFAVLMAIFWPFTVWFFAVSYIYLFEGKITDLNIL